MLKRRPQTVLKPKNWLPTFIVTGILWAAAAGIIYFVDPNVGFAVPLFLTVVFAALFFTTALVLENRRRGLLTAGVVVIFLILRYFGIGNILNFLLLAGVAICVEIYLSRH